MPPRARGKYLGFVAHEIKNPLATALWSCDLLTRMDPADRAGARVARPAPVHRRARRRRARRIAHPRRDGAQPARSTRSRGAAQRRSHRGRSRVRPGDADPPLSGGTRRRAGRRALVGVPRHPSLGRLLRPRLWIPIVFRPIEIVELVLDPFADVTGGVLDLALEVVDLAFRLEIAIAGRDAHGLLDLALRLVQTAFDILLVHVRSSGVYVGHRRDARRASAYRAATWSGI